MVMNYLFKKIKAVYYIEIVVINNKEYYNVESVYETTNDKLSLISRYVYSDNGKLITDKEINKKIKKHMLKIDDRRKLGKQKK